jgi:hypothetical protein
MKSWTKYHRGFSFFTVLTLPANVVRTNLFHYYLDMRFLCICRKTYFILCLLYIFCVFLKLTQILILPAQGNDEFYGACCWYTTSLHVAPIWMVHNFNVLLMLGPFIVFVCSKEKLYCLHRDWKYNIIHTQTWTTQIGKLFTSLKPSLAFAIILDFTKQWQVTTIYEFYRYLISMISSSECLLCCGLRTQCKLLQLFVVSS